MCIERVGALIMKQVEALINGGMANILPPCFVLPGNYFHCVPQRPQGSVSICTSRRTIQSSPLGNVNLTTSRCGMDRLASPQYWDATAVSTARPISGVAADICG